MPLKNALTIAMVLTINAVPTAQSGARDFNATDVMARMRAAYAALSSYADTGTVVVDVGGFADRSEFKTFFTREPRNLFIEFKGIESLYKSGFRIPYTNRLVFWMQNGELQKWDQNGNQERFPSNSGGQVDALKNASYGSQGISVLIPSLVYTKANLATPIQAMEEATAAEYEQIAGRRTFKVMGVERWRYPSGRITGVRPITIWIDVETYLIRKILEDTPVDSAAGRIDRRIITLEPQVNPNLQPSVFQFKIPAR